MIPMELSKALICLISGSNRVKNLIIHRITLLSVIILLLVINHQVNVLLLGNRANIYTRFHLSSCTSLHNFSNRTLLIGTVSLGCYYNLPHFRCHFARGILIIYSWLMVIVSIAFELLLQPNWQVIILFFDLHEDVSIYVIFVNWLFKGMLESVIKSVTLLCLQLLRGQLGVVQVLWKDGVHLWLYILFYLS